LNFANRLQPLGLLVLRLALGTVMIAHGYQKVFGGMPQFMQMLSHIGIPPWMGYLTAAAEFGGGILLVAGFLTRIAAIAIFLDMAVAISRVHLHNGLMGSKSEPGYEFPMVCAAIAFSLIWSGAGPIAMDWLWGTKGGR
jgi:putative oxidoreductase